MEPTKKKDDAPYKPKYTGFDVERTENAQATNERAQETKSGQGEHADATYMEEGAAEYERRTGRRAEDIET